MFFLTTNRARRHRALRDCRVRRCRLPKACRLWLASSPSAATPSLRGCAVAPVTKTRVPRDTKTCQTHVEARKCFALYSTSRVADGGMRRLDHCQVLAAQRRAMSGRECRLRRDRFPMKRIGCSRMTRSLFAHRRESDRFSCRPKGAFVTEARAQPPSRGLGRMTPARAKAAGFEPSDGGRRPNRAYARCPRLWFVVQKTQAKGIP